MIHDIVIDTLYEENVVQVLEKIGDGRLIMDGEEPYLTPDDGYLIVRIKDRDPVQFSRELERRVPFMRVVTVVDRTPQPKEA